MAELLLRACVSEGLIDLISLALVADQGPGVGFLLQDSTDHLAAHTIAQSFGNSYGNFLSRPRFYLINKITFCQFGRIIHSQIVPDKYVQEEKKVIFLSSICKTNAFDSYLFAICSSFLQSSLTRFALRWFDHYVP